MEWLFDARNLRFDCCIDARFRSRHVRIVCMTGNVRNQSFQITIRISGGAFHHHREARVFVIQLFGQFDGKRRIVRFQSQAQPVTNILFIDDAGRQCRFKQHAATFRQSLAGEPQLTGLAQRNRFLGSEA